MLLVKLLSLLLSGVFGLSVRMLLTRGGPKMLRQKLPDIAKKDQKKLRKIIYQLTRENFPNYLAVGSIVLGVPVFLLLGQDYKLFGVLGYLLGLINWPVAFGRGIGKAFDLGKYVQFEYRRYPTAAAQALLQVSSQNSLDEIENLITRSDAKVADEIVGMLVKENKAVAAPLLLPVLSGPHVSEKKVEVFHFLETHDPQSLRGLLPNLTRSNQKELRQLALGKVEELGSLKARQVLKAGLKRSDPEVKNDIRTTQEILNVRDEQAWLQELMDDADGSRYAREWDRLIKALEAGPWQMIQVVREAMGDAESLRDLEPLLASIREEPEAHVEVAAIRTLAKKDTRKNADLLRQLLSIDLGNERKLAIRQAAIDGLTNMETFDGKWIDRGFKSPDQFVRKAIFQILPGKNPTMAKAFLDEKLVDGNPENRALALEALAKISFDEKFEKNVIKRMGDGSEEVRFAAYRILHDHGTLSSVKPLIRQYPLIGSPKSKITFYGSTADEKRRVKASLEAILERFNLHEGVIHHWMCRKHRTRAKMITEAGVEIPVCRKCEEISTLVPNVRQLIGVIGPLRKTDEAAGIFEVSIWNEAWKKASYADINTLLVREGEEMDYDWAVNAVLEELRTESWFVNRMVKLDIQGLPPLSQNSLRLLKDAVKTRKDEEK